jgi:hypothetical protein
MNETYLAWFVIGVCAVVVLPFFGAAAIDFNPDKKGVTERVLQVWLAGFAVFASLSAFIAVAVLLTWALSVVTK